MNRHEKMKEQTGIRPGNPEIVIRKIYHSSVPLSLTLFPFSRGTLPQCLECTDSTSSIRSAIYALLALKSHVVMIQRETVPTCLILHAAMHDWEGPWLTIRDSCGEPISSRTLAR